MFLKIRDAKMRCKIIGINETIAQQIQADMDSDNVNEQHKYLQTGTHSKFGDHIAQLLLRGGLKGE